MESHDATMVEEGLKALFCVALIDLEEIDSIVVCCDDETC